MINFFLFMSGSLAGYFITDFLSGETEGKQGILRSLILNVGGFKIHLHHWFIFSVILIFLFLFRDRLNKVFFYFLAGFLVGEIIQGLTYSDWYKPIYRI